MKFIRSNLAILLCCLFAFFCLFACSNFFNTNNHSVKVGLPSDFFESLCSRAADNGISADSFVLNAYVSGESVNESKSVIITNTTEPISVAFYHIPRRSVITVRIEILYNNTVIYSGKSSPTTVDSTNVFIDLSLSPTFTKYTITYDLSGGSWLDGYTPPTTYGNYKESKLPTASNLVANDEGWIFVGWYEDSEDNLIRSIPAGFTGTKTLHPKWANGQIVPADTVVDTIKNLGIGDPYIIAVTGEINSTIMLGLLDVFTTGTDPGLKVILDLSAVSGLTKIGTNAFYNCLWLYSIILPDSVKTLDTGAFSYCENLTSVTIPNSVTTIDSRVFQNCGSLTSITIPSSVTKIGNKAFNECPALNTIEFLDSKNWYYTLQSDYSGGTPFDVTNSTDNANRLKIDGQTPDYTTYYLYKK